MTEDTYDFVVRDKSAQPPYCKPPPALFVCYRLRGKGTITFLIWHVTSGENVIKGSHYSQGDHLLSSDITLSSLAAVSAVSVESYHFFLAWPHMRTRSKENTNFCVVAPCHKVRPVKFVGYRTLGCGDRSHFVFHVNTLYHVLRGSHRSVGDGSLPILTTPPSLVASSLLEVEKNLFLYFHYQCEFN